MPKLYHLVFSAPVPGQVPTAAQWGGDFQDRPAAQPLSPTMHNLAAGEFCDVLIDATDPTGKNPCNSARVTLTMVKWPVICDSAAIFELGAAFDSLRRELKMDPYSGHAGVDDCAARKLRLRYYSDGRLLVSGHFPSYTYDLLDHSVPAETQAMHVLIEPLEEIPTTASTAAIGASQVSININGNTFTVRP